MVLQSETAHAFRCLFKFLLASKTLQRVKRAEAEYLQCAVIFSVALICDSSIILSGFNVEHSASIGAFVLQRALTV